MYGYGVFPLPAPALPASSIIRRNRAEAAFAGRGAVRFIDGRAACMALATGVPGGIAYKPLPRFGLPISRCRRGEKRGETRS